MRKTTPLGFAAVLVAGLLPSGCYTTRPNLPQHAKSIAVPVFENQSHYEDYVKGLETEVTASVRKAFLQNGQLSVVGRESAAWILEGEVLNLTRRPLRLDRYGEPAETQVKISAKISLYDVKEAKYLFKKLVITNEANKTESGVYNLRRGEDESLGRKRAVEDLGKAIARRVLDRW